MHIHSGLSQYYIYKISFVQLVSILSFVVLLFPPPPHPPPHPGGLEDGHLEVLWKFAVEGEEHRGTLPLKWLQKYCYSQETLRRKKEAARPTIAVRNITHAQTPLCTHMHACTYTLMYTYAVTHAVFLF